MFTLIKIESPNKRTFFSLYCFCGCLFRHNCRSRNWLFISFAVNNRYILWGLDRCILTTWPRICEHMAGSGRIHVGAGDGSTISRAVN